jgi:mannose-1-phosphate guanylyltransferase/phosphomannomutase
MFHREEFRRVTAGEIGDIEFSPRVIEHYTGDVVQAFGLHRDEDRHVKLVLDLSYGAASFVMPNLLSKVGADVLSINPYAQTPGVIAIDRVVSEARVAEAVRGSGADLGAVIDPGGERLTLVDGRGRVLTDDEAIMAFIALGAEAGDTEKVALPVTASDASLRYCAERGIEVALTPLSPSGLLETAASGGVSFASDRRGGYVFPSFLPAFDAAAALARLLSLLGRGSSSLEDLVDAMPPMPIVHEEVATLREQKGLIMRTLMEQLAEEGADLVLVDGIKVQADDGWALVVPDPEDPVTHVWAEGIDLPASVALARTYVERITALSAG